MMRGAAHSARYQNQGQNIRARDRFPKYRKEYAHDLVKIDDEKLGSARDSA